MPSEEVPKVVLAGSDRLMHRDVGSGVEVETESNIWTLTQPVSGCMTINTWQIFKGIRLVLTKTEPGHYQILRTANNLRSFSLVHDHASEIYNLFWLDDGHMIFCASDGWWASIDSGMNWLQLWFEIGVEARSLAVISLSDSSWRLIAYGFDHKIYETDYSSTFHPATVVPEYDDWDDVPVLSEEPDPIVEVPEYDDWGDVPTFADLNPGDGWTEAYDTTTIWSEKWYPAIAGGAVGILAGAGSELIRSSEAGTADSWESVQAVDGIIKSITSSNQSNTPAFLITVEPLDSGTTQIDKLYKTSDLGDSLQELSNRVGIISSIQSVIPTGENEPSTSFVALGRRSAGESPTYKMFQVD